MYLEAVTSQYVTNAISLYLEIRYIAHEAVVVTHIDRQTDIPALPDIRVTHFLSKCRVHKKLLALIFSQKHMLQCCSVEDGQGFLCAVKLSHISVCYDKLLFRELYIKVKQSLYRPRGFQEVKVPRLHDNGTGWW
jgi:hypothetical protein